MPINSSNKNIIYPSGTTASRPSSVNNGFIYFNTTIGALQIYQNGSWYVLTNINAPGVPTSVVATNQGTGRAFNNGQASIAFTPATETFGFPATYTITPNPSTSPATFTGTSSPIVVTGLASSTQYTYTATATNNTGTSSASSASSGVTATTVPQAPTIGTATAGNAQADVTFTAGATGGAAITSYTVTSSPGSITASGATSPITVTGLTNGTSYTFTVTATNSNGTSAASSATSAVSPSAWAPSGAYDALASVTVPSGGAASITFAGIPTGYKHLEIRMFPQSNRGTYGTDNIALRINGDSAANYAYHYLRGSGSAVAAASSTSGTEITEFTTQGCGTSTGGTFGAGVATILDYASTNKYKTVRNLSGVDLNGAVGGGYGYVSLVSGLWMNTSAVTSLLFYPVNGTAFTANSSFALYGVK